MNEHCSQVAQDLFKYFLDSGTFSPQELKQFQEDMVISGKDPAQMLVQKGYYTVESLGKLIAHLKKWDHVYLPDEIIDVNVVKLIPEEVSKKKQLIAFKRDSKGIHIATCNPDDVSLMHFLQKHLGEKIVPSFALPCDLNNYYGLYKSDMKAEFERIIGTDYTDKQHIHLNENAVTKIVDLILESAYQLDASDIHIEPHDDRTLIRYRVDGILRDVLTVPKNIHNQIISRIKVLSHLHTDEHYVPQDGKMIYSFASRPEDIRVSIVPTVEGENAVLRLLSDKCVVYSLDDLGFTEKSMKIIKRNIVKSWGMILVTGPTGAGKTTTLYAVLRRLHTPSINIATIEDPVEFSIHGITQIQVNPKTNLTFTTGLKSIVRQDPDVVMVGEIRDQETAEIAINSAMTGHLVLSTLHTNDAATTIPRLLDMGIEPFLISSTINVVIAQRLVRKICPKCKSSEAVNMKDFKSKLPTQYHSKFESGDGFVAFRGKGCEYCDNTGYKGRSGIFEVLEINDDIKTLIMNSSNATDIKKKALETGFSSMMDEALEKLRDGTTTTDEILRVLNT